MRAIDRDLIRGGHYGQRPCVPHLKAEHMAAPTNAAYVKKILANPEPSTHGTKRTIAALQHFVRYWTRDGVIGQPACRSLANVGAALQADGGTRSAFAASSIRRRSAAWTILLDWTFQSRRPASALWMTQAGSCGK